MRDREAKFWARVDTSGDCWMWTGARRGRYGGFGRREYAHRVSWELTHGPIPLDLVIDHLCKTNLCVNPDHLRVVTQRENLLAGDTVNARNAAKSVCLKGHAFDEVNTYSWRGKRACRRCRADAAQRLRDRRRVALSSS